MKGAILDAVVVPSEIDPEDDLKAARKDAAKAAMRAAKAGDAEAFADALDLIIDLREGGSELPPLDDEMED